jgi:hypothetical protein
MRAIERSELRSTAPGMQVRAREGFEKAAQASSRVEVTSWLLVRCGAMSAVWCVCGCVGCVWEFWRALVGGWSGILGAVQGTRHRGHCCFRVVAFFSVEERERWRVWRCVGDVVGGIGDVLGLFTWRWIWWTSLGQRRRRWMDVGVHIFERGKAQSHFISKNLNRLPRLI